MPFVRRALVVVSAASLTILGCSGRGADAPKGAESKEERALLGDGPDFAAVVRVDKMRQDPVYSAIARDTWKTDQDALDAFDKIASIDLVGALDGDKPEQVSLVLAIRGGPGFESMPPDWRKTMSEGDAGRPLASGVWEYATIGKNGWPWGFYVSNREWVLLAGRAAGHGHDWFSAHDEAPPVAFDDDVLAGIWIGPNAFKRPAMKDYASQPGSVGLDHALLVLRDGAHGDLLYEGVYDTSEHAEAAANEGKESVGMYASVWKSWVDKCPPLGNLGLESSVSGRTVKMRVTNIPKTLQTVKECKGSSF